MYCVMLGGKECVLDLSIDGHKASTFCCHVWSNLTINAFGSGLSRMECLDVAAAALSEKIHTSAFREELYSIDYSSQEEYQPKQKVVATEDAHEVDAFLWRYIFNSDSDASLVPRVSFVGFDTEPIAGFDDDGQLQEKVNMIQIATREACLLASSRNNACFSPLLLHLLTTPEIIKVGKDLRHDWSKLAAYLIPVGQSKLTSADCGWFELVDFLPFHSLQASFNSLCQTFLNRSFPYKIRKGRRVQGYSEKTGKPKYNKGWTDWPLSEDLERYCAADACVVADVLCASLVLRRREEQRHL